MSRIIFFFGGGGRGRGVRLKVFKVKWLNSPHKVPNGLSLHFLNLQGFCSSQHTEFINIQIQPCTLIFLQFRPDFPQWTQCFYQHSKLTRYFLFMYSNICNKSQTILHLLHSLCSLFPKKSPQKLQHQNSTVHPYILYNFDPTLPRRNQHFYLHIIQNRLIHAGMPCGKPTTAS